MFQNIIKKINYGLVLFLILSLPICFLLNKYASFNLYFYQILYLIIPIEITIYVYNVFKKNIKICKYDILIYILIFWGVIATINAVDFDTSIWGAYLSNEGLLTIISYYLLFLNSKSFDEIEIQKILHWLFNIGVIQFIYCLLQVFVRGKYIHSFCVPHMANGFIDNPNMLGSFCILILGLSLMMYLVYNNKKYLILSIIFYINLILAQSSGSFYAFVVLFILMIVLLIIKKIVIPKKIRFLTLTFVVIFVIVSFGVELYCNNIFNDNIQSHATIRGDIITTFSLFSLENSNENKGDLHNLITKEDALDYFGSGRLDIWRNTITIIPKYWVTGAGIDNFGYVYPTHLYGGYVDKAHNEYLQILITQGVFTLITYLCLLICLLVEGIKNSNKLSWILLIGFMGYAGQAFMNISVAAVAPFYFIVCGMLAGIIVRKKEILDDFFFYLFEYFV